MGGLGEKGDGKKLSVGGRRVEKGRKLGGVLGKEEENGLAYELRI